MTELPTSALDPIVPHLLPHGRLVDAALIRHFDKMITAHMGFVVVDYTGTLTSQIIKRLPKERCKDCCLVDLVNPERVFSVNLLQPDDRLSVEEQSIAAIEVLEMACEGQLSRAEVRFLTQSCRALLAAAEVAPYPDWFAQTHSLIKLWGCAGFREYLNLYLWDTELKRYWQQFNPQHQKPVIDRLCRHLSFLFNHPDRLTMLQGRSQVSFDRLFDGQMVFINASVRHDQARTPGLDRWQHYAALVFVQRFAAAMQREDLAEQLLFTSASVNYSHDLYRSYCQIWCLRIVSHAAIWSGLGASIPSLNVTPVMTLAR